MKQIPTIACDEAGYTGQDLLNNDQPAFAFSSVNFTLDEANSLLSLISTNSGEYKFNRLKKWGKFIHELENVLNHDLISKNTVKIAITHKRYSIVAQIVDILIEPHYHEIGYNLYKDGQNLALTNMLYYTMPTFFGNELTDKFQIEFVKMWRRKDFEHVNLFYEIITELIAKSKNQNYKDIFETIKLSKSTILETFDLLKDEKFHIDTTATSLITLSAKWYQDLGTFFNLVVDDSKPLRHYETMINKLMSKEIEDIKIGYGNKTMLLPLKINSFTLVDSKAFPQVQVADLIAGAATHYATSLIKGKLDNLAQMIEKSKISKLFFAPIWPHEAFTSEDLDMNSHGVNGVDIITNIISK